MGGVEFGDIAHLVPVVQVEPTLQELVEEILGNKGLLFPTTAKGKATCINNVLKIRGHGMIHGLRIKCYWYKLKKMVKFYMRMNYQFWQIQELQKVKPHKLSLPTMLIIKPMIWMHDSDCNKLNTATVSLMAKLSHYGSDALAEVHNHDNVDTNMINQAVQVMSSFEQSNVVNHSETKITSDSNINPYSQYNSVNSLDSTLSSRPTKVKVLKELPKVSMNENERLLEQVINKDIVNIVVSLTVNNASVNVHECEKCLKLETELLNKKDFIEKETYDKLFRSYTTLEKRCISLEVDTQLTQEFFQRDNFVSNNSALSFDHYFELNKLKAQSHEKDMVISKLKERIKCLSGNKNTDKVKKDIEEIETINIKLDHRVSKLIAENEHLKQTYKQLYDSIKQTRVRLKEQSDALINQVNQKYVEISDLNVSLQEKDLVITALKDDLRKLKGKALVDDVVTSYSIAPKILKVDVELLAPKLMNNRTVHSEYLRHTQEQVTILKEVVEQGKS
nr:hypothetical protein [Tanacetum cinerariifolium]